jgi:large subunit ribosomal protein L23
MSRDIYHVIRHPLMTEKNQNRVDSQNQYTFEVDRSANKVEVKKAVEELFSVKVKSVSTVNVKGKPKRAGINLFRTQAYKKAIVTLAEGHKIELI